MRGEPIVSSPSDALKTFAASGIDYLVLEDFVVEKQDDIWWTPKLGQKLGRL